MTFHSDKVNPWARPSLAKFNTSMPLAPKDGTIIEIKTFANVVLRVAWRENDPDAKLVNGCWWSVSEAGKWGGILKFKPAAWRYVPSQAKVVT